MSNSAHLVEQVSEAEPWGKSIKLLNPKKNKAKLLGWALLSQNPTTVRYGTTALKLAIYSQGQQKKINYSAPIRDIDLKFWG